MANLTLGGASTMDVAAIGVQVETKTVALLNREIIHTLMTTTSCINIKQACKIADTIVKLHYPELDPTGWCLGTPTKELSDYLESFLVDRHKRETVIVGGITTQE